MTDAVREAREALVQGCRYYEGLALVMVPAHLLDRYEAAVRAAERAATVAACERAVKGVRAHTVERARDYEVDVAVMLRRADALAAIRRVGEG